MSELSGERQAHDSRRRIPPDSSVLRGMSKGLEVSAETRMSPGVWPNGAAQESNLPSLGLPDLTGFEDRLRHRPPPLRGGG
jgi:hypothetical protein